MVQLTKTDMMAELAEMAEYFWAGEAEIAANFFAVPHDPKDHVLWLQHQCLRELRGPGLLPRLNSSTDWLINNVRAGLPGAETAGGRSEIEYVLEQLLEEFQHYGFYADILTEITGEPVRMKDLEGLRLPSDSRLEEMRARFMAESTKLAQMAFGFTEGGGAGIFYAAAVLETDDPLLSKIRDAGKAIYNDEVGHYEHNADGVELGIEDQAEFERLREMVIEVCQERLRMRSEMHGMTMSEDRIREITDGEIAPLKPVVIP